MRARILAMCGVLVISTPFGGSSAAQSRSLTSYEATASAYGLDLTLANPSIPLGLTIQVAGPAAQAQQSSLGASDAFASFPYLGDTVTGLPGLVNALFGTPLPAYPLFVSTQSGSPPGAVVVPGIELQSESRDTVTEASATVGGGTPGYRSTARVERSENGTITAVAESTLSGLDVAGLVVFDAIKSVARVELSPDGTVERSSSLSVGRITVPALNFRIPESTPSQIPLPIPIPGLPQPPPIDVPPIPVPFGGQIIEAPAFGFTDGAFTLQLPLNGGQEFAVPSDVVLDAFSAAGFDITYQVAQEFTGANGELGVIAPALSFKTIVPAPPSNDFYNGATDVTFAVGRVIASAGGTPTNLLSPGSAGVGAGRPPSAGVLPSGGVVAGSGSSTSSSPLGSPSGAAATSSPAGVFPAPQFLPIDRDSQNLYLVLVGCGIAALVMSQAIRIFGVRFPWTL